MPTLHKTTEETKIVLKWLVVFTASLIVIYFLFKGLFAVKEFFFPTPPPPPTVSFGKLPAIVFPKKEKQTLTYSINTLSGTLPVLPDRATVYKTAGFPPNLLSLQRAQGKVSQEGFVRSAIPNGNNVYIWEDTKDINRKLVLNILTYNFDLQSDYLNNQAIVNSRSVPDVQRAISGAQSFLSNVGALPNDVDLSKTITTPLSIIDGRLVKATSLSKAQIIQVDFSQRDINKIPVLYPNPPATTMDFLVSEEAFVPRIVQAHFFHEPLTEISATYPIKTADAAFEELKKGDGYIAQNDDNVSSIAITNEYLAYFANDTEQSYLLPVIVFEGKDFKAYVPAIQSSWTL